MIAALKTVTILGIQALKNVSLVSPNPIRRLTVQFTTYHEKSILQLIKYMQNTKYFI